MTLAERWNGQRWAIQPTPNRTAAPGSELSSVACPSLTMCIAVGSAQYAGGTSATLVERWNG